MTNNVTLETSAPSRLIAAEIRAELGRRQLSQSDLADLLGVSQVWVSRHIGATRCPVQFTLEEVIEIETVLELPRGFFLGAAIS